MMVRILRLCLCQMTATDTHEGNIALLRDAAAHAAEHGAQMLAMPEVAGLMQRDAARARTQVVAHAADPYVAACREAAMRHGLWIHTGSTPVLGPGGSDGPRFLNRSDLIDDTGAIVATYDKIHLFDIQLDGQSPTGESRRFAPGARAVLARTPWGPLGMSVCYDLRFPHLYRGYAQAGAVLLFVPSAFTVPTGRAHWETLLRARAIENGAHVVAAAQVGHHADGRETWGHSMLVDPWGAVIADLGGEVAGCRVVDIDLDAVEAARRQIPSLKHDRPYDPPDGPFE